MQAVRALITLGILVPITAVLIPVQHVAVRFNWRLSHRLPRAWHRFVCRVIGIRVTEHGVPSTDRPLLITPNHASWMDIVTISSVLPVSFVSKAEVAKWPIFGTFARLQRTVFVDRTRRSDTGRVAGEIAQRLADGDAMVLFAEGTSGDGNHILPFRSALIGAARHAITGSDSDRVWIQPMSVAYTRLHGIPMGRQFRPMAAWYGDMDMVPHLWAILREAAIDVEITWGEPIPFDPGSDRKGVAQFAETSVRRMTGDALLGRPRQLARQDNALAGR